MGQLVTMKKGWRCRLYENEDGQMRVNKMIICMSCVWGKRGGNWVICEADPAYELLRSKDEETNEACMNEFG